VVGRYHLHLATQTGAQMHCAGSCVSRHLDDEALSVCLRSGAFIGLGAGEHESDRQPVHARE